MIMSGHKFEIGDKVRFVPAFHQKAGKVTDFEIVRQLPDLQGEFFYRIKSLNEPHERVVGESQLSPPWPVAAPYVEAEPVVAKPKPSRKSAHSRRKADA
jgi:hypothetical protein